MQLLYYCVILSRKNLERKQTRLCLHFLQLEVLWNRSRTFPPTFFEFLTHFQNSDLIGQPNIIAKAWLVHYSHLIVQIKECGVHTRIDWSPAKQNTAKNPTERGAIHTGAVRVQKLGERSMLMVVIGSSTLCEGLESARMADHRFIYNLWLQTYLRCSNVILQYVCALRAVVLHNDFRFGAPLSTFSLHLGGMTKSLVNSVQWCSDDTGRSWSQCRHSRYFGLCTWHSGLVHQK